MIYYPDENNVPSWANAALGALGYNRNPARLQLLIRKVFEEATRYVHDWAFGAFCDSVHSSSRVHENRPLRRRKIRKSSIRIPGSQVVPVPLFAALDGTRSEDYVARVEPSAIGGRKMAEFLLNVIHSENGHKATIGMTSSAPTAAFIAGRSA
jgi:hypothetical protein